MRRLLAILLVTAFAFSWIILPASAQTEKLTVTTHTVTISVGNNGLQVEERILFTNHGSDNITLLQFWVQGDAKQDLQITALDTGTTLSFSPNGNRRDCNLTEKHLAILPGASFNASIRYSLVTSAPQYLQNLQYNTSKLTVTYNSQPLFSGEALAKNTQLSVQLYSPSEAPLGITTLIIIFLLVVIIITLLLLVLRRQRRKKRVGTADTKETLTTKKDLLLELLKDLEKRYRAKTISDETYTKLKEEYKSQAVDSMRRLEDLKD